MGISAASVPITFADGTTYQFSPLTDRNIDQIDEWLQARVIETARNSLTPNMTQAERDETLGVAMRESQGINFLQGIGIAALATINGMTFICWLSLRREHPLVTQDELRAKLSDPDNLARVNNAFHRANRVASDANRPYRF